MAASSPTMATESTVSAILKEVYPEMVEDSLNTEVALWVIIQKQKVQIGGQGKHLIESIRVQRAQGFGARNDNDPLPVYGSQVYQNATVNMTTNYFKGQITGRTIRTSETDEAAFERALDMEMRYGLSDFANEIGRQLFRGSGQLTTLNGAVSASTTITVVDTSQLGVGMYVEFFKTDNTNETAADSGQTGTKITAITSATQFTVTTAQTLTSGDAVARAGNNTGFSTTKELQGLDTIVDDGTDYGTNYFGINRSTYSTLQGNRFDMSNSMTEDKIQQGVDSARKNGGGFVDIFITDYKGRRTYSNLLQGNKRYPIEGINAPQFAGGWQQSKDLRTNLADGLSYDGVIVVASRQAPAAKMWGLDTGTFRLYQQSEVEWVMNGGSVLHPLLNAATSLDAYSYSMYYDAQLYCIAPNRSVKYVNIY